MEAGTAPASPPEEGKLKTMGTRSEAQTITVRRSEAVVAALARKGIVIPSSRGWRADDPPATTVGELGPDDLGGRVVIRSGAFLGTVCGTLLGTHPHPSLVHFTCVQLSGNRLITFRDDVEAIVVDHLHPRDDVLN